MLIETEASIVHGAQDVLDTQNGKFRSVIFKPSLSRGILITTNIYPTEETGEEWLEKINFLLQHGIDVFVSTTKVTIDNNKNYNLVYNSQNFTEDKLREFLTEHNIQPLDGTTR